MSVTYGFLTAVIGLSLAFYANATAPMVGKSTKGACPDGKTYPVALTFDDGPNPKTTPRVIDTLLETQTPAPFFVLGDHFVPPDATKEEWALLRRERASGFIVASHTFSHLRHTKLSPAEIEKNMGRSGPLIGDYLAPVLRLPYGDGGFHSSTAAGKKKNADIKRAVRKAGYTPVLWDIDSEDWKPSARPNVLASVLDQICKTHGGIVLFHDVQVNTAAHLKEWIAAIRAAGHELVGLPHFVPAAAQMFRKKSPAQATCPTTQPPILPQDEQLQELHKHVIMPAAGDNDD